MPNPYVSANATHLPLLTRRNLLAGAASAAVSSVVGPAQAARLQPRVEPTLARRFSDALAAYAAAERHCDACEQRFLADCPDPPAALTRAGPLGKLKREWDHWTADALDMLLSDSGRRKYWRAARKLLPVARRYERKVRAVERDSARPAAEAAQRAASDALLEASQAILAAPASSTAALALKARVVRYGKPEWWDPVEGRADDHERLAAQIVDAAIATTEPAEWVER